jgi:D-serine dehydratase
MDNANNSVVIIIDDEDDEELFLGYSVRIVQLVMDGIVSGMVIISLALKM